MSSFTRARTACFQAIDLVGRDQCAGWKDAETFVTLAPAGTACPTQLNSFAQYKSFYYHPEVLYPHQKFAAARFLMSWDVMIFNTRGRQPPPIENFEKSEYEPVGPAAVVRQQLSELLPGIDWSDPTWGRYDGDGFWMSFNVGDDDPIDTIGLRIVGGGDAVAAIVTFARPLGWSALDYSTGEFLDLENPSRAGWEGFQAYRDRVIGQEPEKDGWVTRLRTCAARAWNSLFKWH